MSHSGKGAGAYTPEVKERIVELARSWRSPVALARECEPTDQTIRNWGGVAPGEAHILAVKEVDAGWSRHRAEG